MAHDYDGLWEATFTYVQGPGLRGGWPPEIWRIEVGGSRVQVFHTTDGKETEVKPGKFKIEIFMTNALIFAMDSGGDSDGTWVETEVFVLTQKDRDTLGATLTGAVNNVHLPLDRDISKFFYVATAELRRTKKSP